LSIKKCLSQAWNRGWEGRGAGKAEGREVSVVIKMLHYMKFTAVQVSNYEVCGHAGIGVSGFGFGCRASVLLFRVSGYGFRNSDFRIRDSGFGLWLHRGEA
jgi:hypothetical protein